ncbi:hypothetical protein BDD12DRAFT_877896 [Trichophaea hybrida]|nr:hypothetical protein BDD12DRAFT_877896 [Trichophaea hybrida]
MATSDRRLNAQSVEPINLPCQDLKPGFKPVSHYRQSTPIHAPHKQEYQIHQREAVTNFHNADWEKFSSGIAPLKLINPSISNAGENGFSVVVNDGSNYELWSGTGAETIPISNFVPCSNPNIFLERVARLAQYRVIENLRNPDNSLFSKNISFRVKDYPFSGSNEAPVEVKVKDGDEITIVFQNNWDKTVNLTIFDLQPLWGITQIYPDVMDSEEIDPEDEREIQLEVTRPPGITGKTSIDTIKAFITVDPTSFRDLEMEDIDTNPDTEIAAVRRGGMGLQSLLDHLITAHRHGQDQSSCKGVWDTREITVRVAGSRDDDGEDAIAQQLVRHLSTVIATGKRDIVILPESYPTMLGNLKEAALKVFNLRIPRFVRRYREIQHTPGQRNVQWRCRCGKIFTGAIPLDLAKSYMSYQPTSSTAERFPYPPNHNPQLRASESNQKSDTFDTNMPVSQISHDFIYLCVKTCGKYAKLESVRLPSPGEGRYDNQLFLRLRETYINMRGALNIRNVTSINFSATGITCLVNQKRNYLQLMKGTHTMLYLLRLFDMMKCYIFSIIRCA